MPSMDMSGSWTEASRWSFVLKPRAEASSWSLVLKPRPEARQIKATDDVQFAKMNQNSMTYFWLIVILLLSPIDGHINTLTV